jgi:hypothetical protein
MNDNVKEILIDLVDYYSVMGTGNDPGIDVLENVVQRASIELRLYAIKNRKNKQNNIILIDPFELPEIKHENEF